MTSALIPDWTARVTAGTRPQTSPGLSTGRLPSLTSCSTTPSYSMKMVANLHFYRVMIKTCVISGLQTAILGLQFTVFRLHLLGPMLEIDLRYMYMCNMSNNKEICRNLFFNNFLKNIFKLCFKLFDGLFCILMKLFNFFSVFDFNHFQSKLKYLIRYHHHVL